MKNTIKILFLSLVFMCSCDKAAEIGKVEKEDLFRVSQEDIISYLTERKGVNVDAKSYSEIDIRPVLHNGDIIMYIVNYEDGWDVLSADRRAPVVLMTCDKGYLNEADMYLNDYQSEYMDVMKDAIYDLMASDDTTVISDEDNWSGIVALSKNPDTWTDWYLTGSTTLIDTVTNINHLLTTHWGQQGKWNHKAPFTISRKTVNCPTVFVMVAGSQLLYYLHYKIGTPLNTYSDCSCSAYVPDGSEYVFLNDNDISFDESSYGSVYWDLMPLSESESVSQVRFDYVSTLMLRIGYLISAQYGAGGTGAPTFSLLPVFEDEFSITGTCCYNDDFDIVRTEIYKGLPCIFSIGSKDGGHCVVADGFRRIITFRRLFYQKHNNLGQIIKKEERVMEADRNFVAINWGWDGYGDYDKNTGATIWYNTATINWQNYDRLKYILYGFEAIEN